MGRKTRTMLMAEIENLNAAIEAHVEGARAAKEEADRRVGYEQLQRVSAQRGLIERRNEPCVNCGQKWHTSTIGYDPDRDGV